MPKLLFTDEQKAALSKEAGITGVPDTNTFDKEYDPSTGDYKMYMKLGTGSKFFGKGYTKAAPDPLAAQVEYVQNQYGGKTMQDIYSAMISTQPKEKGAIRDQIGMGPGGIYSQLDGITQQIANLQKMRAGDQTKIFNAVGPDGRPIDPRVAVAQYQASQKALTEQENNLRNLQDIYNAQLETLTDSEYQRQSAINDKNKTALSYLKDVRDEELENEKLATDKAQWNEKMAEEKRQFNITNGIGTDTMDGLSTVSFADKAYLYPNEASLKNNNPAGIKNSITDRTRQLLIDAGVKWEGGTKPPPGESGQYMKFASVADGVKAHRILLTSAGTDDVEARLKQWVGTSEGPNYAKQLMDAAGITSGAKFSSLSEEQINKLVSAQMQKESPGFYKELSAKTSASTTTGKKPKTFNEFIEKYNIPDIQLDEKGTEEMLQAVLKEYPTEKLATVADALANRAPAGVKTAIEKYKNTIIGKELEAETVGKLIKDVPTLTESTTKTLIRGLENSGKDPKTIISTLYKSGFFDTFGPWSALSWGNDDQWEVVRDFATENDLDVNKVVEEIKKKEKESKNGTESTK